MEQSPSQQNWQPYNWLKPPGLLRLQSFQAVAQGADSVMYFQWRRGRGGIEKLHGAIVEHPGMEDARVFREVSALGEDLKRLGTERLGGRVSARVALLFDWENWWAAAFLQRPEHGSRLFKGVPRLLRRALRAGRAGRGARARRRFLSYDVILAPVLCLIPHGNGRGHRVPGGGGTAARDLLQRPGR